MYETDGFLKHYLWFLCGIGLPGNLLTILVVLSHKPYRPATLLLGCLAIFDSAALITKLIESQILYNKFRLGWLGCKLIYIPSTVTASIANWTLALICAERCIAVCYPLKRLYLMTTRRSKCLLVVMSAVLGTYVSVLYALFMVDSNGEIVCVFQNIGIYTFLLVQYASHIIAPFILISCFTVLVIRQLHVMRNNRQELRRKRSINESPILRQESQENKMSLLMIGASLLYFIVNAPSCLFYTVIWPATCIPRHVWFYVKDLLYVINDSSHALNFFVYFALVKGFRSDLYKVISNVVKQRRRKLDDL